MKLRERLEILADLAWRVPGALAGFGNPSLIWASRARDRHGRGERPPASWLDLPLLQRIYLNPAVSGAADVGWFEWAVAACLPGGVARACNLGCGEGGLERHAHQLRVAERFDAFDLSAGAIEIARRLAAASGVAGVEYRTANLDNIVLEQRVYGAVFASMSLHHVRRLERLLDMVRHSLLPGGYFIFNEYVGPDRFQWSGAQLGRVNGLLRRLPERLRRDVTSPTRLKRAVVRNPAWLMRLADPSEAVRSSEILALARERFEQVRFVPYGGTILHMLLHNIAGNFRDDRPEDVALLRELCDEEAGLLKSGALQSDFAMAVFRVPHRDEGSKG